MVPTSFDESNAVIGKPDDMTHDECECLSVFRGVNESGYPVVVSCWKMTKEELEEITRTGRVWLVVAGMTHPPAYLHGQRPWTS